MPRGAGSYPLKVTITKFTKGECPSGFKIGDSWDVDPSKTPNGMCSGAYGAMAGALRALGFGADFPWAENSDLYYVSCPDHKVQTIYEIRRIRE